MGQIEGASVVVQEVVAIDVGPAVDVDRQAAPDQIAAPIVAIVAALVGQARLGQVSYGLDGIAGGDGPVVATHLGQRPQAAGGDGRQQ